MDSEKALTVFLLLGLGLVSASPENFCKSLTDFSGRVDVLEDRTFCISNLVNVCEEVTQEHCMEVDQFDCEVVLVPSCRSSQLLVPYTATLPVLQSAPLNHCTKEMVYEYHLKTVYECQNVTKTHCTTLWKLDDQGQKVWAGNEDDCRDVTWEECNPVVKEVPFPVPTMNCEQVPYPYIDLVNVTMQAKVSVSDCTTTPVQACSASKVNKCAKVTYERCAEVPDASCQEARVPVPSQTQIHKQWCLFDHGNDGETIDFDQQVRDIIGQPGEEVHLVHQPQPQDIIGDVVQEIKEIKKVKGDIFGDVVKEIKEIKGDIVDLVQKKVDLLIN